MSARKWTTFSLWHLTCAVNNGGLKWCRDPHTDRNVLRARDGRIFDYAHSRFGCVLRKRYNLPES
jgi:hypothetical protein